MGNDNSTTVTPVPEKPRGPGPGYPNYYSSTRPRPTVTYQAPTERDFIENDRRNNAPRVQSKKIPEETIPHYSYEQQQQPPPTAYQPKKSASNTVNQPSYPIENKEHLISTVPIHQSPTFAVKNQEIPSPTQTKPFAFTASHFEKAPMIQLNYVVRSPNNQSIHTYEPDNIIVMRRTSTQTGSQGTRWYENNSDQNSAPHVVKYF